MDRVNPDHFKNSTVEDDTSIVEFEEPEPHEEKQSNKEYNIECNAAIHCAGCGYKSALKEDPIPEQSSRLPCTPETNEETPSEEKE